MRTIPAEPQRQLSDGSVKTGLVCNAPENRVDVNFLETVG